MYHYFEVLVSYTFYCIHPRLLSIQYRPSDFDGEINFRLEANFQVKSNRKTNRYVFLSLKLFTQDNSYLVSYHSR